MGWLISTVVGFAVIIIIIMFLNRFYVKPNSQTALIRTGFGGHKIVTNSGLIVMPFLHQLEKVNLKSHSLNISLIESKSVISKDFLRADLEISFYLRVGGSAEEILTAAQIYGNRLNRADELSDILFSKFANAVYCAASKFDFMTMLDKRDVLVSEVFSRLEAGFIKNGLVLEAISISHFDQTELNKLDPNNALTAIGLNKLSKIVSLNRQERIEVETKSEISIQQTQLDLTQQNLLIEQEKCYAKILHDEVLQKEEVRSKEKMEQLSLESKRKLQEIKISEDHKIEMIKIFNSQDARKQELEAILSVETEKSDNKIKLLKLKETEIDAQITLTNLETSQLLGEEESQTKKDLAREHREKQIALLRAEQASAVSAEQVASQANEMIKTAQAEAELENLAAHNLKMRLLAEAEGNAAIIASENTQSAALIAQKIIQNKLQVMPEIARQMMKPVEKIESIRINQISGIGNNTGTNGDENNQSTFDQALNSILGMSVSLPFMKKMGEQVGLDMDTSIATRMSDSASRSKNTPQKTRANT
ncbi:MAG: hypothetical protein OFPII_11990 [Osedax symbiont Rs1]|nr:MAG: hypothetical protein OFPII_11990 [Osedax symbiont Rs1]